MSLLFLPERPQAPARAVSRGARVLVAEPDRSARQRLIAAVNADARFDLVGEAADGVEALNRIEVLVPDIVLMAMDMPRLNGRDVVDALGGARDFALVFTANARARGIRALHAQAVDYLELGAESSRVKRALDRAHAACLRNDGPRAPTDLAACSVLTIKTVEGVWLTLAAADIVRMSAAQRQVRIVTRDGEHVVRKTLRELASRLGSDFVRVRRNELVHVSTLANSAGF